LVPAADHSHNSQYESEPEAIMPLVTWDVSYSVKVKKCDDDHKKLFAILNSLHEAMSAGKGSQMLKQTVSELLDYTKFHFSGEEALMQKTNYPALAAHRAQHKDFIGRVENFHKDLEMGKMGQSIAVLNFLKDWLSNHIKQTDHQYADHLNQHGIS
jgi:hemerythrin